MLGVLLVPAAFCLLIALPASGWFETVLFIIGAAIIGYVLLLFARDWRWERMKGTAGRLIQQAEGRYIRPDELDPPAQNLMLRGQKAVDTVFRSEVHEAGMLDRIRNEALLPSVEWELAKLLRYTTRLRHDHPEFQQAIPQSGTAHAAYRRAQRTIIGRVEALERYAERVLAADIAYQLAGGDQHALADLEALAGQADAAYAAFRASLDQAVEAAKALDQ